MKKITLNELNLLDIGNTIQISGLIMSGSDTDYLCYLPEENQSGNLVDLEMGTSEWEKFLQQTDVVETEVLAKAKDGKLTKILLRKSQRQVEAGVSWKVFERDGYRCRYCGVGGVPLTIDHILTWESGGPSIEANLVTACRKCNKLRGNMEYSDWLKSEDYLKRSEGVSEVIKHWNTQLINTLDFIPRKYHIQKR